MFASEAIGPVTSDCPQAAIRIGGEQAQSGGPQPPNTGVTGPMAAPLAQEVPTMFYRMLLVDPLGEEEERELEGLFTAAEIVSLRERYYERSDFGHLIVGRPAILTVAELRAATLCTAGQE